MASQLDTLDIVVLALVIVGSYFMIPFISPLSILTDFCRYRCLLHEGIPLGDNERSSAGSKLWTHQWGR